MVPIKLWLFKSWKFIKWLIKNPIFLLVIVLIAVLSFAYFQNQKINALESDIREKNQNIGALENSVTHYVTELEREVTERIAFAGEAGAKLADLEQTIEDLEEERRVISLQDINTLVTITDKEMETTVEEKDTTTIVRNKFEDEWATVETTTTIENKNYRTNIDKVEIPARLLTGVTQRDDGMLVTFVSVDNPYVEYEHKGFVFDPEKYVDNKIKKRHIVIGVLTGIGVGLLINEL